MLDVVCIHAAACDVAIADESFRHTASPSGVGVVAALLGMLALAHQVFPEGPETERMISLMDFQVSRTLAAWMLVRVQS